MINATLPLLLAAASTGEHLGPVTADTLLTSVPSDAVMVVSAQNLAAFRARGAENAWYQFFQDDQVQAIGDHIKGMMDEEMRGEMPFDPFELLDSIQGSAAFFLAPAGESSEPAFGLLVNPGAGREQFDGIINPLIEMMESEVTPTTRAVNGIEVRHFASDNSWDPDIILFDQGGTFGILGAVGTANVDRVLEGVLNQGAEAQIASCLAGGRQASGGRSTFEFAVSPAAIIDLAKSEIDDEMLLGMLNTIGVSRMEYIYTSFDLGKGEQLDMNMSLHVPSESWIAEFFSFVGPPPMGMAPMLPKDTSAVSLMNFDFNGLYGRALEIFAEMAPDEYEAFRGQLDMAASSFDLDVEGDLLGQLTGDFAAFNMTVPEDEMNDAGGGIFDLGAMGIDQGNASIIGLVESDVVEIFLEDVMALAGMDSMLDQEEHKGHLINSFGIPGQGGLYWAFVDGAMIFSSFPSTVRAVVDQMESEDTPNGLQNEAYKPFMKAARSSAGFSIGDTRQAVRGMLGAMGIFEQLGDMGLADDEALELLMSLPSVDADVADKYFKGHITSFMHRGENSFNLRYRGQ